MANNSYSDPMQGGLPPKFCPSCGTPNPGRAKFCSRCGFNFQTITGGQPQQQGVPQQGSAQQNVPRQNSAQQNVPRQNSAQPNVPHQNAPRPLPNTPKPAKKAPVALFALIPVLLIAAAVLVFLLLHGRKTGEQETAAQTTDASVSENIAPSDGGTASAPENAENTAAAGEENTDPPKQVEIPGTAEIVVEDASGTTTTVHVEALPRPIFMAVNAKTTASGNISPAVNSYTVSPDLSNIVNLDRMYLSNNAKNLLAQNGFYVAARSGGDEFYETYEMNRYSQRPSFVTTDSMMHTYHLYFSHLMKNTERNYLSASLTDTAKLMLSKSAAQLEALKGTEWEMSAKINTAFFGVGAALLDPSVQIPADVQDLVNSELSLISAASGISAAPAVSIACRIESSV